MRRSPFWGNRAHAQNASGFTLVELMIAMLLGLIVVAGVISVFLAGQKSYRTNAALGDVQDSSRIAFEMLAQDIRKAGLTGCDSGAPVANLLNNGPVGSVSSGGKLDWWADFENAVIGYGTDADPASGAQKIADSDSLIVLGAANSGYSVNAKGGEDDKNSFETYENHPDLKEGDIVMMCDPGQAALFQISNVTDNGKKFDIAATAPGNSTGSGNSNNDDDDDDDDENGSGNGTGNPGGSPGNCTTGMAYPTLCGKGNQRPFKDNSQVAVLNAVDWYVGSNDPAGGTSLYRVSLQNKGGTPTPTRVEMVRNVTGMTIRYHQKQDAAFVAANTVSNWAAVNAVRVTLTVESGDKRVSTSGKALEKTFAATMTLRNRVN